MVVNTFYCRKKGRLTTNQIADLMEDLDGSDQDPNYEEEMEDSDSGEEEDNATVGRWSKPAPEVRVFMDPPVERPDGDTDKDSGKKAMQLLFFHSAFLYLVP
jgi:hypothetical protein